MNKEKSKSYKNRHTLTAVEEKVETKKRQQAKILLP